MFPSWAKAGAMCVCVDENWEDAYSCEEVVGPEFGDICTITRTNILDGKPYIRLAEWGHLDWAVRAFRPLTQLEKDVMIFTHLDMGIGDLRDVEVV